jgi:hypothetical protein
MLYDNIPETKRELYLKDLLEYVVDKNGLASIPKQDLEACFVYLFKKHVNSDCDIYTLSKLFKIKESKLKSLMELFYLKFINDDNESDEMIFLTLLSNVNFQIESIEKVEINFHFNKIEYYSLFQQFFRKIGGSIKFDKYSESVIVNQNRLYDVLEYIWSSEELDIENSEIKKFIQKIIGNIGNSIDKELRMKLRENKDSKLSQAITYASNLAGIGSFIITVLNL